MSARFTDAQLEQIRAIAESTGTCPTCLQGVAINAYGISPTMIETLRQMARITERKIQETGERAVDVRATSLDHNHRSSLSKLRQHGLIAKVLGENGAQIAGHWVITRKGYDFLGGSEIDAKVEVFNNTVLGHIGGTTNIEDITRANKPADSPELIEHTKIGVGQAAAIGHLRDKRDPTKTTIHSAEYIGTKYNGAVTPGLTYQIEISQLITGQPIELLRPYEHQYKDVSAFMRDWKIQR